MPSATRRPFHAWCASAPATSCELSNHFFYIFCFVRFPLFYPLSSLSSGLFLFVFLFACFTLPVLSCIFPFFFIFQFCPFSFFLPSSSLFFTLFWDFFVFFLFVCFALPILSCFSPFFFPFF